MQKRMAIFLKHIVTLEIGRETFSTWRRAYESGGNHALMNDKPSPENHKPRVPREIEDKYDSHLNG
jgi:hypothetical protein